MKAIPLLLFCLLPAFLATGQEPFPLEEPDMPVEKAVSGEKAPPGYAYNAYGDLITANQAYWRDRGPNYVRTFSGNGKIGVRASDGTVLIPPQYDQIQLPYGGFMIAAKDGRMGAVNEANEAVIPIVYSHLEVLYSGVPYQFPRISDLKELRLIAKDTAGQVGIINGRGQVVSPFRETRMTQTQYFYSAPRNQRGQVLTPPENYAAALQQTALIYRFKLAGAINGHGETLLDFEYDDILTIYGSRNPAWVQVEKNGQFGLYDLSGRWLLPIAYSKEFGMLHRLTEDGNPFYPTLFIAHKVVDTLAYGQLESKVGLIDSTGNELLPFAYDDFGTTFEHKGARYFIAKQKGGWGLLDDQGELRIPFVHPKLLRAYKMNDQRFFSLKDSTDTYYGLLSMEGELAVPFRYKYFDECNGQLLEFMNEEGLAGLINTAGVEVLPADYSGLALLRDGYFQCVSTDRLNGVVRPNGQVLLEPRFKGVYPESLIASFQGAFQRQGIPKDEVITVLTNDEGTWVLLQNEDLIKLE
jgi:hypothetical protein